MSPPDFLTPEQCSNLARLALHLKDMPVNDKFSMRDYAFVSDGSSRSALTPAQAGKHYNECGTSCCAAGHGPLIGIAPKRNEQWPAYVKRVFGVCDSDEESEVFAAWAWMFDPDWPSIPSEAAARIGYLLVHGVNNVVTDGARQIYYRHVATAVPVPIDWSKIQTLVQNGS